MKRIIRLILGGVCPIRIKALEMVDCLTVFVFRVLYTLYNLENFAMKIE